MFLGPSSFISVNKPTKKEITKSEATKTYFMFLDSSLKGRFFEVATLPSPDCPLKGELYLLYEGKIHLLRGIKPNIYPVSLFVNNRVLNEEQFLAATRFDSIFIVLSILYVNHDKYVSMPQRIYDLYRGEVTDCKGNHNVLESGVFSLWNSNVDQIQDRILYICDSVQNNDKKDILIKPNNSKVLALLEYKVRNLEKCIKDRNIMMGAYCTSKMVSQSKILLEHHVSYDNRKLNSFAWSVISTMLSDETKRCLPLNTVMTPLSLDIAAEKGSNTEASSSSSSSALKIQKKRKIAGPVGTPSILNFFKAS
ncbi:hypothetical protein BgAZ_107830 [Babesia gibsoni]|uniref:Uncharacterized protein n=1 Tax=Babesia gibsoni TaxID=33632 RepID=A0AAD8PGN1_BABGI|nr:hypothetical protein BgAZ_107830 [Babesia gibsoni]